MSSPTLSVAEMKDITRRYAAEPWNDGKFDIFDEACSPDFRLGEDMTVAQLKQIIADYRKGVPDLQNVLGKIIVEGDAVAFRWTMTGTHLGEYLGIAPTGKKIKATGITIIHFRDGKIYHDEFESGSPSFADQVK